MVFDISNPFGMPARKVIKGKPKDFKKVTWGMSKISTPERYSAPTRVGGGGGRLKKISRNKITNMQWTLKNDPTVVEANRLLADLGKPQIGMSVRRRRRGRYDVSMTGDPLKVIEDYHKQKNLIDWGKKVGGLALDPKRKVTVVATSTPRRVARVWCHNNRCRTTGYDTVYDKTYKDVLATSLPKGERWNLLLDKMGKEADAKKARFVRLYKPLDVQIRDELNILNKQITEKENLVDQLKRDEYSSREFIRILLDKDQNELKSSLEQKKLDELKERQKNLQYSQTMTRYSYYGFEDKELAKAEKYKENLITGIKQTDKVTDEMKRGINKNPDVNKSEEEYKKMLIEDLEKEYDQEKQDFEQTAKEVQKRETVFAQSSAITRPNNRIVKLATQKRQPVQRQTKTEPNNVPLSTQRGQGFKRFARW